MTVRAAPPTDSQLFPTRPTLAELRALELRYDGPIPSYALTDLRAVSGAQVRTINALNEVIDAGRTRNSS